MHGIIYRHIGRTGSSRDGQKSAVFRRGKSGNPIGGASPSLCSALDLENFKLLRGRPSQHCLAPVSNKYQQSQTDPCDALTHAHRAVNRSGHSVRCQCRTSVVHGRPHMEQMGSADPPWKNG